MNIRYSHIQESSLVDGPGKRTVFFMQGCERHCPGCQNRKLWSFSGGSDAEVISAAAVLASIAKNKQITISGGEPFLQPIALGRLVLLLHLVYHCHVIVYTGYTWQELTDLSNPLHELYDIALAHINVLVDGPYVQALDDGLITYRGSRNQRAIDVQASRKNVRNPVLLDWNEPEVVIDEDGNMVLPIDLQTMGAEIGEVRNTRMCGQTAGG
jgi:anaerobic ribonucleoside-triphosphate reductase activating protein